jgi:Mannosyl-glycoprotein endo-beta-N-acetylglucosaminidase
MSDASFIAAMTPYAVQAASATGLDCRLFLVQWALESTWGTSTIARNDSNFAGIEWPSASTGCTTKDGIYTHCDNAQDFTHLYIAIINGATYASVRATAGQSLENQMEALGRSPWAESRYSTGCGYDGCELVNLYHDEQSLFDGASCVASCTCDCPAGYTCGPDCSCTPPASPPSPSPVVPLLLIGGGVAAGILSWRLRRS